MLKPPSHSAALLALLVLLSVPVVLVQALVAFFVAEQSDCAGVEQATSCAELSSGTVSVLLEGPRHRRAPEPGDPNLEANNLTENSIPFYSGIV